MNGTCAECKHSRLIELEGDWSLQLECWRYPPIVLVIDNEPFQHRPQMHEGDTCGEWVRDALDEGRTE